MGLLREDYKDALFDGQRRYQITQNEDGTYTVLDVTTYTQEGDRFGANDINETNKAVNDHISDKNNPHGIKAGDIGAFGTFTSNYKTDLNSFVELGSFMHTQKLTNGNDVTYGVVWNMRGYYDGYLIQHQFDAVSKMIYTRTRVDGVWSTWKKLFDNSQTIPVANGGTGVTTLTSGAVLIGNGTGAVQTRPITNNTTGASASGTNIPTCNTLNYHVQYWLNRGSAAHEANTLYAQYMARGIALVTSAPSSLVNGCCAFVYQ